MTRYPKHTLLGLALGAGLVLTGACAQDQQQETQPPTEQKTETKTDAKTETKTAASPAARTAPSPVAASPSPSPSPSPMTTIPFGQDDRLEDLAGQRVQVASVPVQSVPGDRGFWIGPSEEERLFVLLEEGQTVEVSEGDNISVQGEFQDLPPEDQLQDLFDLAQEDLQAVVGEPVYIQAESVEPAR